MWFRMLNNEGMSVQEIQISFSAENYQGNKSYQGTVKQNPPKIEHKGNTH